MTVLWIVCAFSVGISIGVIAMALSEIFILRTLLITLLANVDELMTTAELLALIAPQFSVRSREHDRN
jgi:hypothetical protein